MKTAQLLQTLNNQLSELAAQVAPLAERATLSPRFDRQLFHTRSTLMQAYLAEAQHNFHQLRQAVERQQLPQVADRRASGGANRCAASRNRHLVAAQLGPCLANAEPLAAPSPTASGV